MTGSPDDNPFVIAPRVAKPWTTDRKPTRRWLRAVTLLVLCVGGVCGLHELSQRWLISRLADNLEAHPPHVQIERLGMLAEFGERGLPSIVSALASSDDGVSAAAFRVLRDLQGRWQTTHSDDVLDCQETLLRSLAAIAEDSSPERRGLIADLLNQLVLDTVGTEDSDQSEIYRRACELLATVTDSEAPADGRLASPAAGSSAANDRTAMSAVDGAVQLSPLPATTSIRIVRGPPVVLPIAGATAADEAPHPSQPQPIEADPMPILAPLSRSSFVVTPVQAKETMLGGNPLAAYDTRSVIDFVGSVQPALQQAAEEELRKRNFSNGDLELATRLTSPSAQVRLAMVEELAGRSDVDPRMWLIWLAHDPERDVRLQAIARLGTMDDPEVHEALRERLKIERDPTVATRLRRFLGLR